MYKYVLLLLLLLLLLPLWLRISVHISEVWTCIVEQPSLRGHLVAWPRQAFTTRDRSSVLTLPRGQTSMRQEPLLKSNASKSFCCTLRRWHYWIIFLQRLRINSHIETVIRSAQPFIPPG